MGMRSPLLFLSLLLALAAPARAQESAPIQAQGEVRALAWGPDGNSLIAAVGESLFVWDAADGHESGRYPGFGKNAAAVAFHPASGRIASVDSAGTVVVRSGPGWADSRSVPDLWPAALALAFGPDGSTLAIARTNGIAVFELEGGTQRSFVPLDLAAIDSLAWQPSGRLVAIAGSARLKIYDTRTRSIVRRLDADGDELRNIAWSVDGSSIFTVGLEGAYVWDPATGDRKSVPIPPHGADRLVAIRPDGGLAAFAGSDDTLRFWDFTASTYHDDAVHATRGVRLMAWSPDGTRLAILDGPDRIRLVSPRPGLILEGHDALVECVRYSPDGLRLASSSPDGSVRLWDGRTGQAIRGMAVPTQSARRMAWNPRDSRLAMAGVGEEAWVRDVEGATPDIALPGHFGEVRALCWTPDGGRLATSDAAGTLRVWRFPPGDLERFWVVGSRIQDLSWHPTEARLAGADARGTVTVWDPNTGATLATSPRADHPTRRSELTAVRWSPNGTRLATVSRAGSLQVRHGATLALQFDNSDAAGTRALAWSPDGTRIASAGDSRSLFVVDAATGTLLRRFRTTGTVYSLDWSPDGKWIAYGGRDALVRTYAPPLK